MGNVTPSKCIFLIMVLLCYNSNLFLLLEHLATKECKGKVEPKVFMGTTSKAQSGIKILVYNTQ